MAITLRAKKTVLKMRYIPDLSRRGASHMAAVTLRLVRVSRAVHDVEKQLMAIGCCVLLLQ